MRVKSTPRRDPPSLGPVVISLAAGLVVLLAGLFVNGCRISKLLGRSSSEGGSNAPFAVSPLEVRDSALIGSTAARVTQLDVSGGSWLASADNPWIHLSPTSGSGHGSVRVVLDPQTLTPGLHKGSVTVQQRDASGSSIAVAVSFFIQQPILNLSSDGFSYTARSSNAVFYDTVEVTNDGSGPLAWTAKVAHGASWVSLGAMSGTAPGEIPLRVSNEGLTIFGTFRDTIVVEAPGAKNSPGKISLSLRRRHD